MEQLKTQVQRAQRTLIFQQFLNVLIGTLFAGLVAAAIAVAIPKVWVLELDEATWLWSWVGGAIGASLLIAGIWTYVIRQGELEAALEIDRRFGLKERVASSLSLSPEDRETEAGRALVTDASRRVERLEIGEKFGVTASWWAGMPLVPGLAVAVIAFCFANAQPTPVSANQDPKLPKEVITKNKEALKNKIEEARKKAEQEKLPDAGKLFEKLVEGLDKSIKNEKQDVKETMTKLNDLAQEIKQRRDQLAGNDKLKQQLNNMKDVKRGPADKMANAMKEGDFKKALDEMKNLKDQLKDNKLDAEGQKQLAEQLDQMKEKLQQLAEAHDQAKRDLAEQIKEKVAAGDREAAGKLQQQLDKLNQQNGQMDKLKQMAQKLGQACQDCKNGQQGQAGDKLGQMAQDLEKLAQEAGEMQALQEALDQIAQAKEQMGCKECNGQGCKACQGQGMGEGDGKNQNGKPGNGLGQGKGIGARPERDNPTKFYDSKVASKIGQGKAVVAGTAGGANVAGETRQAIKSEFTAAKQENTGTLTEKPIPRAARDHAKEYLDRIREGE